MWGGVGNYTRINKIILIKIILKNFQLENHDRQGYRQARAVDVMDEEAEVYRKLAQKMLWSICFHIWFCDLVVIYLFMLYIDEEIFT